MGQDRAGQLNGNCGGGRQDRRSDLPPPAGILGRRSLAQPAPASWASRTAPRSPAPALPAFHEGASHRAAKAALAASLAARGISVSAEAAVGAGRRADLLVLSPSGRAIAIEIQHSAIALAEVERRTADHAACGVATLWLPLLDLPPHALRPVRGAASLRHGRLALPAWIPWVENRSGALWIWHAQALWRAWLGPAWTRCQPRRWADLQECGWRQSKRFNTLTLEGPIAPHEARLRFVPAATAAHTRFGILPGPCATLVRAGETAPPRCPTDIVWQATPAGVRPMVCPIEAEGHRLH